MYSHCYCKSVCSKQVNPGDVTSVKAIRKAMGITFEPVEVKVEEETGEIEPESNLVTERSTPTNASQSEVSPFNTNYSTCNLRQMMV